MWGPVIRTLAGYDVQRYTEVARWNIREACIAFTAYLRREALAEYRHQTIVWAMLAPHQKEKRDAPKLPAILKE